MEVNHPILKQENTQEKILNLNKLLEDCLANFPISLPLTIDNSTPPESIINFLSIHSILIKYYSENSIDQINISPFITEPLFLSSKLKFFFKRHNETFIPDLDLIIQNNVSDTNKLQQIIYNLHSQFR